MKYLFLLFLSIQANAACSTKEKLNEEGDYLGCEVTVDDKTTTENIANSGCAAYCQLLKIKNTNATYQEFRRMDKITTKPGELKNDLPANENSQP